jgi:hypothetical protein
MCNKACQRSLLQQEPQPAFVVRREMACIGQRPAPVKRFLRQFPAQEPLFVMRGAMLCGAIGALGSENVTAGFELPIRKK